MKSAINTRELAAMLRAKRGKRSLRAIAEEIGGVSAPTLMRIERGQIPDLDTFARLCRWLGVSPEQFMPDTASGAARQGNSGPHGQETAELIVGYLRADRTLDPETAEALAKMVRLAYRGLKKGELGRRGRKG